MVARKQAGKTTILWGDPVFMPVEKDLARFMARKRGRRLKDLALLGLLAERHGFTIGLDAEGLAKLTGIDSVLVNLVDPKKPDEPGPQEAEDDLVGDDFLKQFMS